jgi:hypothetical protein
MDTRSRQRAGRGRIARVSIALSRYKRQVFELGCAICRRLGYGETPPHLHHPRTGIGAGRRAKDTEVIPLCPEHHQGSTGLHGLGRKLFERTYGATEAELTEETKRLIFERHGYRL